MFESVEAGGCVDGPLCAVASIERRLCGGRVFLGYYGCYFDCHFIEVCRKLGGGGVGKGEEKHSGFRLAALYTMPWRWAEAEYRTTGRPRSREIAQALSRIVKIASCNGVRCCVSCHRHGQQKARRGGVIERSAVGCTRSAGLVSDPRFDLVALVTR